jgi:hypothetical protein
MSLVSLNYFRKSATLALVPGVADACKRVSNANGNLAWYAVFTGVIVTRNLAYTGAAITAVGIAGSRMTEEKTWKNRFFKGVTAVGAGVTLVAGASLYKSTSLAMKCFDGFTNQYGIRLR